MVVVAPVSDCNEGFVPTAVVVAVVPAAMLGTQVLLSSFMEGGEEAERLMQQQQQEDDKGRAGGTPKKAKKNRARPGQEYVVQLPTFITQWDPFYSAGHIGWTTNHLRYCIQNWGPTFNNLLNSLLLLLLQEGAFFIHHDVRQEEEALIHQTSPGHPALQYLMAAPLKLLFDLHARFDILLENPHMGLWSPLVLDTRKSTEVSGLSSRQWTNILLFGLNTLPVMNINDG